MPASPRCLLPTVLLLSAGCATAIPDSLQVAGDSGSLAGPDGLCGDRNAGIGAAPVERVTLVLDCLAPNEDGQVQSCTEALLYLRDAIGGLEHLKGLSQIEVEIGLPATEDGRSTMRVIPRTGAGELSDGLFPELRIDLPTVLVEQSLQTVPEDDPKSCEVDGICAFMGLNAVVPEPDGPAQQYPLGTAASGVLLLDGIGWDEDPVILELEVPFFAPESTEATTCADGLIHYEINHQ